MRQIGALYLFISSLGLWSCNTSLGESSACTSTVDCPSGACISGSCVACYADSDCEEQGQGLFCSPAGRCIAKAPDGGISLHFDAKVPLIPDAAIATDMMLDGSQADGQLSDMRVPDLQFIDVFIDVATPDLAVDAAPDLAVDAAPDLAVDAAPDVTVPDVAAPDTSVDAQPQDSGSDAG